MNKSCRKQRTSKYTTRNSPPFPANQCQGRKMKGNDGTFYLSKPDKRGIFRWEKINKTKKTITKPVIVAMAKKYMVTTSGTKKEIANRILTLGGIFVIKSDKKILESV
jgi:hypothetical protein